MHSWCMKTLHLSWLMNSWRNLAGPWLFMSRMRLIMVGLHCLCRKVLVTLVSNRATQLYGGNSKRVHIKQHQYIQNRFPSNAHPGITHVIQQTWNDECWHHVVDHYKFEHEQNKIYYDSFVTTPGTAVIHLKYSKKKFGALHCNSHC